jgi:hypothetical protein
MKDLSPVINKKKVILIACQTANCNIQNLRIFSRKPENTNTFFTPSQKCWYVFVPWNDGKDRLMLRSSRVLLISKKDGEVLYDGDAGDEG